MSSDNKTNPIMSRRRNKIVSSSDGWSNVVGKGRSPLRKPTELGRLGVYQGPRDELITSVDYEGWLKEAKHNLIEKTAEIKGSKLWGTIKYEIENFVNARYAEIRNIVVLGLGSLSGNTKESSFYQLALVTEIYALLQDGNDHQCYSYYIQDPAFTPMDIRFFQGDRKAIVLQHPEAETRINGETFLYAPHLEYEILQTALRHRPSLVFCNDIQNFLDTKISGSNEYSEFKDYVLNCNSLVLGNVDKHDDIGNGMAFNHSALYWYKQKPIVRNVENTENTKEAECVPSKVSQVCVGNTGSEVKGLDGGVQEIIQNIEDYKICVSNSQHINQSVTKNR